MILDNKVYVFVFEVQSDALPAVEGHVLALSNFLRIQMLSQHPNPTRRSSIHKTNNVLQRKLPLLLCGFVLEDE